MFCYLTEKSRQKFKYLENEKLLRWQKKRFSSFLKGFQLPKIVSGLTPLIAIINNKRKKKWKKKRKKCDIWVKPWLEWKNQQEQSPEGVLQIRFFEKLRKIHCSLFNEVSGLGTCNFIKRWPEQRCFPTKFLRASIL